MGWDKLPVAIGQHLLFTLVSVAIGFALGLVQGIQLSRRPKLSGVVLPVLSVFNTIPGIVFIGLLVLAWGAGTATVLVALGIYATFPVLKNTYAGLVSVDQQYIEAARGCGMSAIQSLIRVELPEGRTIRYVYDSADRPVCRLEEDRKHGICRSRVYRYADTCAFAWEELYP